VQVDVNKSIGKVVKSDFNVTPGKLNDVSDVDVSDVQYTSPIVEKMKQDGVYDSLCNLVRSISFADKSDSFLIERVKDKFKSYCGALKITTFKKWLTVYVELRDAYYSSRGMALGELVNLGMERARASVHSDKPDDFIIKLMDRIDDGTLSHKNKAEVIDKAASGMSPDTIKTISKVFNALGNIEEPAPPDEEELMDDGEEQ